MANRLLTLISVVLAQVWKFFQLPFPGTDISIAALLFFPMVVSLTLALIRSLFGVGGFAQVPSAMQMTSSTAKVDRLNAKQTEREARRFVK